MEPIKITIDLRNTTKCGRAGFLSTASMGTAFFLLFVSLFSIVILTMILRQLIKSSSPPSTNTQTDTTSNEALPPPYSPLPSAGGVPASSSPLPRSSAALFVLGSALFSGELFAVTTLAFCIQNLEYCPSSPPDDSAGFFNILCWFAYSLLVLFASSGFVVWCLLLRNLWGGGMKEVPLDLVAIVVATPFILLGQMVVAVIRASQGQFCSQVLDEEGSGVEAQGLVEAVELEAGSQK
jgi:hypothetical protein